MDELAFRRIVYQIAVSLMERQLVVVLLLSTAIKILQQNIQFRTSMLSQKEAKTFTAFADKLG
jgi:hypothetical protein